MDRAIVDGDEPRPRKPGRRRAEEDCMIAFLTREDYVAYLRTGCFPRDGGAYIEFSERVPTDAELRERLERNDRYATSYNDWYGGEGPERAGRIEDVVRHQGDCYVMVRWN